MCMYKLQAFSEAWEFNETELLKKWVDCYPPLKRARKGFVWLQTRRHPIWRTAKFWSLKKCLQWNILSCFFYDLDKIAINSVHVTLLGFWSSLSYSLIASKGGILKCANSDGNTVKVKSNCLSYSVRSGVNANGESKRKNLRISQCLLSHFLSPDSEIPVGQHPQRGPYSRPSLAPGLTSYHFEGWSSIDLNPISGPICITNQGSISKSTFKRIFSLLSWLCWFHSPLCFCKWDFLKMFKIEQLIKEDSLRENKESPVWQNSYFR